MKIITFVMKIMTFVMKMRTFHENVKFKVY